MIVTPTAAGAAVLDACDGTLCIEAAIEFDPLHDLFYSKTIRLSHKIRSSISFSVHGLCVCVCVNVFRSFFVAAIVCLIASREILPYSVCWNQLHTRLDIKIKNLCKYFGATVTFTMPTTPFTCYDKR